MTPEFQDIFNRAKGITMKRNEWEVQYTGTALADAANAKITFHQGRPYGDIRELTAGRLAADGVVADVICGGFPCQDISVAGRRAGIDGERSGLWSEYARLIGAIRPRYVIVENVAALLNRGIERVLGDLAAIGYDAEWHCIPASYVGAPHRRDRIWIVAYPHGRCLRGSGADADDGGKVSPEGAERFVHRGNGGPDVADANGEPSQPDRIPGDLGGQTNQDEGEGKERQRVRNPAHHGRQDVADPDRGHEHWRSGPLQMGWGRIAQEIADYGEFGRAQWSAEPDVGRVAHGVPARVDRLCGLGNAVVPQIPEIIGRAIMTAEAKCTVP